MLTNNNVYRFRQVLVFLIPFLQKVISPLSSSSFSVPLRSDSSTEGFSDRCFQQLIFFFLFLPYLSLLLAGIVRLVRFFTVVLKIKCVSFSLRILFEEEDWMSSERDKLRWVLSWRECNRLHLNGDFIWWKSLFSHN